MREIKFRAWDKANQYMVTGEWGGGTRLNHRGQGIFSLPDYGCIWMQYTGLRDKNGKEIYEGDIVTAPWHWKTPHAIELPRDYCDFTEYAIDDEMMVIGNKYENPELIKQEASNGKEKRQTETGI